MSLRGRRPWQSASPAVQSTARPQRGRKRTDCQKANCPEGAREATLGCVGLCPPRNDAVILTRSFFCQCGPDTPGGVSLQASILVLLRHLEHHTAVTVGRSACGRPPPFMVGIGTTARVAPTRRIRAAQRPCEWSLNPSSPAPKTGPRRGSGSGRCDFHPALSSGRCGPGRRS